MIGITDAFAQNNHTGKKGYSKRLNYHIKKDTSLIRNIENMHYDSVMIFSFGCLPFVHPQPKKYTYKESGDFMLSDGLVDSTQHWLPLLSDTGKIVKSNDLVKLLTTFKHVSSDVYEDEPSGCFEPHMGIMFYKNGLVNAHMDVCLTCGQISFEKFANGHVIYRYNLGVLGNKTRKVFTRLGVEYNIRSCQ